MALVAADKLSYGGTPDIDFRISLLESEWRLPIFLAD